MNRLHVILYLIVCIATSVTAQSAKYIRLVDPFWGNGKTSTPESEGWARGWNWLKAQTPLISPDYFINIAYKEQEERKNAKTD